MSTHNNPGDTLGRVAALLQMLRNNCEDAGRKSHVKQPVSLGAALFNFGQVVVENLEGLILVVLARDV